MYGDSCRQCDPCNCCCQNNCSVGELVRIFSGRELTINTQVNEIVFRLTRRLPTVSEKRFLEGVLGCGNNQHCECCNDQSVCF